MKPVDNEERPDIETASTAMKYLDPKELLESGLLAAVNIEFFHPLGLALELLVDEDGAVSIGGVWDCRDDPEGVIMGGDIERDTDLIAKMNNVLAMREARRPAREKALGYFVQPIGPIEEP